MSEFKILLLIINHHFKKGKLGFHDGTVTMDLGQTYFSAWVASFDASFNNITPYIIDVGLRSMAIIILGEERAEHSAFIKESYARWSHSYNGSTFCIYPQQKTSASLTFPISNVLRVFCTVSMSSLIPRL